MGRARDAVRTERGAAAVEFALVVPMLLVLTFGLISYGYMLSFRQSISQAAAEGARAAAITPGGVANTDLLTRARQAVDESLSSYGVTCASAGTLVRGSANVGTCVVELAQRCAGTTLNATCVRVTLDYAYRANALVPTVGTGYLVPDRLRYVSEVQVG